MLTYIEAVVLLTSCIVGGLLLNGTTKTFHLVHFVNDLSIWVDKETGVQYLVFTRGNGTGITPLLNADGSLRLYEPEVTETRDED